MRYIGKSRTVYCPKCDRRKLTVIAFKSLGIGSIPKYFSLINEPIHRRVIGFLIFSPIGTKLDGFDIRVSTKTFTATENKSL